MHQSLTHLQRLELSHDGYIPPRLREAASVLDQIEERFRRRKTARIKVRLVTLKPAGHIERLAGAMVAMSVDGSAVTRRDLIQRGFTEDELDLYGDQAVARAHSIQAERAAA